MCVTERRGDDGTCTFLLMLMPLASASVTKAPICSLLPFRRTVCVCVRARVCVCVYACVRACVRKFVRSSSRGACVASRPSARSPPASLDSSWHPRDIVCWGTGRTAASACCVAPAPRHARVMGTCRVCTHPACETRLTLHSCRRAYHAYAHEGFARDARHEASAGGSDRAGARRARARPPQERDGWVRRAALEVDGVVGRQLLEGPVRVEERHAQRPAEDRLAFLLGRSAKSCWNPVRGAVGPLIKCRETETAVLLAAGSRRVHYIGRDTSR